MKTFFLLLTLVACLSAGHSQLAIESGWTLDSVVAINPTIPVKGVHSGMMVQEIIAALGQPTQTNATGLEYTNLGIFICPIDNEFRFFQPFAGRSQWGIGIGSKEEKIIQAYGMPLMRQLIKNGSDLLSYPSDGLKFGVEDGVVAFISTKTGRVTKGVNPEPVAAQPAPFVVKQWEISQRAYARAVAANPDVANQSFDVKTVPDEFFEEMSTTNTQITLVMETGIQKPTAMFISVTRGAANVTPEPTNWILFQVTNQVDLGKGDGERSIYAAARWSNTNGSYQGSGFGVTVLGSEKTGVTK